MAEYNVSVGNLPAWIEPDELLGPGPWVRDDDRGRVRARAQLEVDAAADLVTRLRALPLAGRFLTVECSPQLSRAALRRAKAHDLERRRETTPGFRRPGTRLDQEGRFSLTPEALALELGRRARGRSIIDAGCGVGGNAIGFARAGCNVVAAIERSETRIRLARHNARVYRVDDRIRFIHGNALALLAEPERLGALKASILFVDPPWGRDWARDLPGIRDMPLLYGAVKLRARFDEVWAKLPPSFDPAELPDASFSAIFGASRGDRQRVKFLLARLPGGA